MLTAIKMYLFVILALPAVANHCHRVFCEPVMTAFQKEMAVVDCPFTVSEANLMRTVTGMETRVVRLPDSRSTASILNQQGESTDELYGQATRAFSAGNYQEALAAVTRLCQQKPDNIRYQLLRGDISFAAGEIDDCIAAFDAVVRIQPALGPRLWQRGLALYYAGRFAAGARQFETHQTVNSQDVENAVWHLLCAARLADLEQARRKLIPISRDPRVPMPEIYEMFAGRLSPDDVIKAARQRPGNVPKNGVEYKLQLYHAYLYIGLFHEMQGHAEASIDAMKQAEKFNPLGKTNFMGQVARVHLQLRSSASRKQ